MLLSCSVQRRNVTKRFKLQLLQLVHLPMNISLLPTVFSNVSKLCGVFQFHSGVVI